MFALYHSFWRLITASVLGITLVPLHMVKLEAERSYSQDKLTQTVHPQKKSRAPGRRDVLLCHHTPWVTGCQELTFSNLSRESQLDVTAAFDFLRQTLVMNTLQETPNSQPPHPQIASPTDTECSNALDCGASSDAKPHTGISIPEKGNSERRLNSPHGTTIGPLHVQAGCLRQEHVTTWPDSHKAGLVFWAWLWPWEDQLTPNFSFFRSLFSGVNREHSNV